MSGPLVTSQYDESGNYYASVIVSLDTHQLRVSTTENTIDSFDSLYNLDKDNKVSVINWLDYNEQKFIGIGLTNGLVLIYSPFTKSIITTLATSKNSLITSIQYSSITNSLWISDNSGQVYEFDIYYNLSSSFSINEYLETNESVNNLKIINLDQTPHILVGSHSIHLLNLKTKELIKTFPAHIQPVKSIIDVNEEYFITSAEGDRFINLYSLKLQSIKTVFVAEAPVIDIDIGNYNGNVVLVAKTENKLEIFNAILSEDHSSTNSKKKRKQMSKSRSPNGSLVLKKHPEDIKGNMTEEISIITIKSVKNQIFYSWLENVSDVRFDKVQWIDETDNYLINTMELTKKKMVTNTPHHSLNGNDVSSIGQYNEGNTIVSDGFNLNNVEDDEDSSETLAEKLEKLSTEIKPSVAKKKKGLSNNTLTTILSQSLRNNDMALLETVLGNRDQQIIQNTILRLDSSLAILLLDRISEKLARQSTKFDQLIYWIKWIIIIHGSVLASLPGLTSKLSNLHGILTKKSDTLPRLMQLKSKMEVIYENNEMIKSYEKNLNYGVEEDEDTDVEYIEELDDGSDIEDEMMDDIPAGSSDEELQDYSEEDEEVEEDDEEIGMVTNDYIESDED
ncbi:U3 small nucleolar RNA-associated protein 5 [[Candida] jaroonii]|uniref:U3 small nucleolar RNA-associated protein 5 n=1 Tax=[Candida] jaroonii TaxID=467808 RepID=A0ACA9YC32_9ASCO|nr:U3 small nucleolar RNA-associated protein 5 [[Candida] jaroonii]